MEVSSRNVTCAWEEGIIISICFSIGNREIRNSSCVIVGGGDEEVEYLQGCS